MFRVISENYQTVSTSLNKGNFICTTYCTGWNPHRNVSVYMNMKGRNLMVQFLNAMRT